VLGATPMTSESGHNGAWVLKFEVAVRISLAFRVGVFTSKVASCASASNFRTKQNSQRGFSP
jgi:hypothetical protein